MSNVSIEIIVNGTQHRSDIEPRTLLVQYLRDQLGLTGTHVGCDTSQCGACTVLIDGVASKSCTVLAAQADGHGVTTIEGMAPVGFLHPIQRAFWEEHGLQCGYCTPGMIMTTASLLNRNDSPTESDIRHELDGNLCRCTGYHSIVNSVMKSAELLRDGAESTAVDGGS